MAALVVNKASVKETLTPFPNGIESDFLTAVDYVAGSVSVWVNGRRSISGMEFVEVPPNIVRWVADTLLTGDSIQAQYDPE